MPTPTPIPARELPCPQCGYDLRATPRTNSQARCPECGTLSSSYTSSKVPWLHRQSRGTIRAYLQTIWMLVAHRRQLPLESAKSVNLRQALRFHTISIWVATIFGTALLMVTFFLRGDQWIKELTAHVPSDFSTTHSPESVRDPSFPMNTLTDSPWIAIPIFISLYLCLELSMWVYRGFLRFAAGKRSYRERVRRLGYYASGLLPPVILILGMMSVGGIILYEEHLWLTGPFETALETLLYILAFILVATFYLPTSQFVWQMGRWRICRLILMYIFFPYAAILAGFGSSFLVFWTAGYLALASWSMFT